MQRKLVDTSADEIKLEDNGFRALRKPKRYENN
jgi:hypothetical protein